MIIFSFLIVWVLVVSYYCVYRATRETTPIKYVDRPQDQQLVHVVKQIEHYKPLECHASVVISDSSLADSRYDVEHLEWAKESLVRKLMDYVRPHIKIEIKKEPQIWGTEMRASLTICERDWR